MTRLDNIALRQRRTRVRDAVFATLVAIAAAVSVSTVHTAILASAAVAHR